MIAALNISVRLLEENGSFVSKVFRGKDINSLFGIFKMCFKEVYLAKPKCSRNTSIEAFMVAKGFKRVETLDRVSSKGLNVWDSLTVFNHLKVFQDEYYGKESSKEEIN